MVREVHIYLLRDIFARADLRPPIGRSGATSGTTRPAKCSAHFSAQMVVLLRRPAGLKLAVHLVRAFGPRRCLHACDAVLTFRYCSPCSARGHSLHVFDGSESKLGGIDPRGPFGPKTSSLTSLARAPKSH